MTANYFTRQDDMRGEVDAVPDHVLTDVISSQTTILYGAPGVGKGRVMAELLLAGIRGEDWAGKSWAKPLRSVVIVTTDAGGSRDYIRYLDRAGLGPLEDQHIFYRHVGPGEDWDLLTKITAAQAPDLLVVDNATEAIGGDMSEQRDVGRWLMPFDALPRAGVPVVLVSHTAKPSADTGGRRGQTPLGSTLWEAWARSKVLIRPAYRAEDADLVAEIRPRYSPPWEVRLANVDGYGGDRLEVRCSVTTAEKRQEQDRSKRDRNQVVADKINANCVGMTKTQVASWVVENEPSVATTVSAAKTALTRGRQWAGLLTFDDAGHLAK